MADHSKWGVIGISSIARLDQADILITDVGIDADAAQTLRAEVRQLMIVDPVAAMEGRIDRAI